MKLKEVKLPLYGAYEIERYAPATHFSYEEKRELLIATDHAIIILPAWENETEYHNHVTTVEYIVEVALTKEVIRSKEYKDLSSNGCARDLYQTYGVNEVFRKYLNHKMKEHLKQIILT